MADAPAQPMAVTPIAVGNLSVGTPVQAQGYPYYSPDYYPGYDPYYAWGSDWGNPWSWGWPVAVSGGFGGCWNCGFRGGFFRPGFRRFGFGRPGFFHPGFGRSGFGHPGFFHPGFGRSGFAHASFGGGFRGGGRR
jgi:hypothetical protein